MWGPQHASCLPSTAAHLQAFGVEAAVRATACSALYRHAQTRLPQLSFPPLGALPMQAK